MKRRLLASLVLIALVTTGCAATFTAGAAVVNGVAITKADLAAAVKSLGAQGGGGPATPEAERGALQSLITAEVVRQAAQARKAAPTTEAVDEQLNQIKSQFQNEAEFQARMTEAGLTLVTLRERIVDGLTKEALTKQLAAPVTAEQVAEVYKTQRETFRQISTKHIMIALDQDTNEKEAKSLAQQILTRLKAGESFTALAKKYSDDPGSKDKGGKLGAIPVAQIAQQIGQAYADAAEAAKIGVPVGPVKSQIGYHVIVTLSRKTQPLSEVSDTIRTELEGQSGEAALADFLRVELGKASIQVNPRYGDWDAASGSIAAHQGFTPASPALDPNLPPGGELGGVPPAEPGATVGDMNVKEGPMSAPLPVVRPAGSR